MYLFYFLTIFALTNQALAEIFIEEKFVDDSWKENWVQSEHEGQEYGKFVLSHGKFWNDESLDKGLQTSQDAKFYAISRKFDSFSNENKPLVIQYSVKHEQNIDCGGGYIKVFDCSLNPKDLHGETPYLMMFGPDICGPGTKKVHAILNYKGKNLMVNKNIRCKDDVFTHLYTFIITPDNSYEVLIDNEMVESGKLEEDWDFLPPKKIKDPSVSKPTDWEDEATIPDPEDKKPADWEKPEHIHDPEASKPEDWDDEMDGEWEAPMIDNPEFKGEWKPKQISNPNYKGPWVHPEIDNPEYSPDQNLYLKKEICAVGFDLWQVKSGSIFDNILITDDVDYAKQVAKTILETTIEGEKKMKEKQELEAKKDSENEDASKSDDSMDDSDIGGDDLLNNNLPDTEEHDEL